MYCESEGRGRITSLITNRRTGPFENKQRMGGLRLFYCYIFSMHDEPLEIPRFLLNSKNRPRKPMHMIIHVSIPTFYMFEGWLFEYTRTKPFGPWPCKKDFEPRKKAGKKFYEMFNRFNQLSICKQDDFEI